MPEVELIDHDRWQFSGSRLACDGITAVLQANLTACIASKPAPTYFFTRFQA